MNNRLSFRQRQVIRQTWKDLAHAADLACIASCGVFVLCLGYVAAYAGTIAGGGRIIPSDETAFKLALAVGAGAGLAFFFSFFASLAAKVKAAA